MAQLWLRYLLDKWLVVLPKTTSVERLRTNLELDFALSYEDVLALDDITDAPDYGEHSFFPVFGWGGGSRWCVLYVMTLLQPKKTLRRVRPAVDGQPHTLRAKDAA